MKKSLQLLFCALASVNAATKPGDTFGCELVGNDCVHEAYDYLTNGKDWATKVYKEMDNKCGDVEVPQSPIDLKNSWPKVSNLVDRFSKVYTDQTTNIKVHWNGHTSHIDINKKD
jgi:hypothetical protein